MRELPKAFHSSPLGPVKVRTELPESKNAETLKKVAEAINALPKTVPTGSLLNRPESSLKKLIERLKSSFSD